MFSLMLCLRSYWEIRCEQLINLFMAEISLVRNSVVILCDLKNLPIVIVSTDYQKCEIYGQMKFQIQCSLGRPLNRKGKCQRL